MPKYRHGQLVLECAQTYGNVKVAAYIRQQGSRANFLQSNCGELHGYWQAAPSGRVPSRSDWFTSLLASTQRLQRKAWTLTGWTSAAMDPVGYKRVNKRTGREITKENIVKGVEYEDDKYVIISPEEIEAVFPKTTQTITIERFIEANELPFVFLERPYYVAPINKSDKVYTLLREALISTGKNRLGQSGDCDKAAPGGTRTVRTSAGAVFAALGRRSQNAGQPRSPCGGPQVCERS